MVAQHFNDVAIPDLTVAALLDHALKLGFERLQLVDPAQNLNELCAGDFINRRARLAGFIREPEQVADRLQRKPQCAAVPDKGKPVHIRLSIKALVTR